MSDGPIEDPDTPMSPRAKVVSSVVFVLALLAAVYVLFRLSSPAITADQAPPPGHYAFECGLCHTVSAAPAGGATP